MSGPVELQITVYEGESVPSGGPHGRVFTRTVEMGHAPNEGERIYLLASDEDPDGRADTQVRRRYWAHDGHLILQLVPYHIDPVGLAVSMVDGRHRALWTSSTDGDLYAALLASGFTEYR